MDFKDNMENKGVGEAIKEDWEETKDDARNAWDGVTGRDDSRNDEDRLV